MPSSIYRREAARLGMPFSIFAILATATAALAAPSAVLAREPGQAPIPAPRLDEPTGHVGAETAILAGGCFWGVQGVYQHVKGVESAVSGYAGGTKARARYGIVATGRTGHAESVKIRFDPRQISYGRILQIYFSIVHNPTELNWQGPDTGTQYRSTIFPIDAEQALIARAYIEQLDRAHAFGSAIVTTIEPGKTFYRAEASQQDFLARNPNDPYIVINDLPKIRALQHYFPALYRPVPVLVAGGLVSRN